MVLLSSNTFNISDGNVIGQGYITTTINEFMASYPVTNGFTLSNLYVNLTSIPGGGNSRTFTVRINGVNTSLAVVISDFATSGVNLVDTATVNPGDRISLRTTSTGSPMPATCEASYEYAAL
jgi:hypothetical protein